MSREIVKAVILTKSEMDAHDAKGLCTTGFDLKNNRIVRFVSNEAGGPIEKPYFYGFDLLDVVTVEVKKACPIAPQNENLLVDQKTFVNKGKYSGGIEDIYQKVLRLYAGKPQYMDDYFSRMETADRYSHSLEIKKVRKLKIDLSKYGKTEAAFTADGYYRNLSYQYFRVKDPKFDLNRNPDIEKDIGDAYIVVSIPYDPYTTESGEYKGYYKLVAAIYPAAQASNTPVPPKQVVQPRATEECPQHHKEMKPVTMFQDGKSYEVFYCFDCGKYYSHQITGPTSYNNKQVKPF